MPYNDEPLSHTDSLGLINQMISTAREENTENGEGWIIWGWTLFLASIGSVIFIYAGNPAMVGMAWTAVLPVGGLLYAASLIRQRKRVVVKTFISTLLNRIEAGFFISLIIMIAGGNIIGYRHHQYGHYLFAFYFILYAFWMYIHGSVTRFKPLLIGAYVNWAAAIAIFFLVDFSSIMLISAVAVLAGYIIPGHIRRSLFHKQNKAGV